MPPKRRPKKVPKKPKQSIPKKPKQTIPKKEVPEKVKRSQRKKVTLESHQKKFDDLLKFINSEIERKSREKEKGTRTFQRMRKMVRELKDETPKLVNAKRRKNPNSRRVSGFGVKYPINAQGAAFLQIKKGTLLNRQEVTNAICVYAHWDPKDTREQMARWSYLNPGGKRDLQKEGRKEIIEPDETLTKLLGYDEYREKVKKGEIMTTRTVKDSSGNVKKVREVQTDDAMYYRVIQKLIGRLFER